MNKFILAISMLMSASAFAAPKVQESTAVDMTKAQDCIYQQVKEGEPGFVIQCGSDVVMTHQVSAWSSNADHAGFKTAMKNAMSQMMGGNVKCDDFETEALYWIICQR